jgi:uncharacterized hydrophobic protein (TIGR00271 family)
MYNLSMLWGIFTTSTEKEKEDAVQMIITHATPRHEFFLLMLLAMAMAGFGVLLNSTIILIGSMLIAPMLYPLLSLGLGIIMPDEKLMARSLVTLGKSVLLAIAVGFVLGLFFADGNADSISVITLIGGKTPSLMYAIVAVIAGFAGAYAMSRVELNETLPGVAIAVALVPPLAVTGIALSHFEWSIASNAFVLFVVNAMGITLASVFVFSLFGFSQQKKVEQQVVKKEDKAIATEAKEAARPEVSA